MSKGIKLGDGSDYQEKISDVFLGQTIPIVGVGVTAFNRIGPALVYDNYHIFSYKNSSDLKSLEKYCPILSMEKEWGEGSIRKLNTLEIVRSDAFDKYVNEFKEKPYVFLYKSSARVLKVLEKMGLEVIANKPIVRDMYEDKKEFFKIGREIGMPMIPGEQWKIDDLSNDMYEEIVGRLGEKIVFQLTDIILGGGKGTFFVNSYDEFGRLLKKIKEMRREKRLDYVNITKYVSGPSCSVTGCVTRHGILSGAIQTQVIDMKELTRGLDDRRGVYQGHDWSFGNYGDWAQTQAESMVNKLGKHMFERGYKGIFGIDLIVDEEDKKVYPVECNPRYTGAFPVYSMLQKQAGEIPLDMFQLLEFMDIDYDIDFEKVNNSWKQKKHGAHLVLSNPSQKSWASINGDLPSGVYKYDGELRWVREGATYMDLMNDDEFVLTDGFPMKGQKIKPGLRIGKIIFGRGVLEAPDKLNDYSREVVGEVYRKLEVGEV